ncbi:protein CYP550B2 [Aspergillus nidulans FGSC A4]|uniref:Cytochrome P450, putative (Eurofung) n=1 Tax=Emericella nidulans (strain FGSC A4 / ATCC 38163 / CBS 112.46 / NRRL 194 / M139) TaxID=227321 RepID=C8VJS0_EMENI|nr:protein CYP550B2 [Aspergillus nidulans FGSC A4]CBF82309.1 TPA: cytochrome P450, putative (Eurofung) [Aspergillus nidulans FGSC A4]
MDCISQNSVIQRALLALYEHPVAYSVITAVFISVLCRKLLYKPRNYALFPVWATIEVAIASYLLRGDGIGRRVFSVIRRYGGSLFGITSTHQILVDFPGLDRFMARSLHTLNAEPVQYTIFTRTFGGVDSPELKRKLKNSWKDLLAPIERLFLNDASAAAALDRACVLQQAASFVSFSSSPAQMKRWELSAGIRVIPPAESGSPHKVEANLQSLTRDFGACMAIPLLYGRHFLDGNPTLLDDFWKFDNELFPLLMIGVPEWTPLRIVKDGCAARARILRELEALYRRIDQSQCGEPVESGIDMSDVSGALFERSRIYKREGWSFPERAAGDFAIFWGQNANTHPLLFWFLAYIYSTPGLLDTLRAEIAPYTCFASSQAKVPEITSIDFPGLSANCQLLKACLYETYRLVNEPISIRYVERPVTLTDGSLQHTLKTGTWVSAAHSLTQHNASIFDNPAEFRPERFLETDQVSGKRVARYGRLRPWGAGAAMCKGRTFAEKELTSAAASIVSLWDIEPAYGQVWKLPGMVPGTGVKRPVRDIRVLISRRQSIVVKGNDMSPSKGENHGKPLGV